MCIVVLPCNVGIVAAGWCFSEVFNRILRYIPSKFPLNVEYRALHPMVRVSKDVMIQNQSSEEEAGNDGADDSLKHKHPTLDPAKPFVAVQRAHVGKHGEVVRLQIRGYDRGQYDGWWVTEYTRHGSRTIHCLPSSHLNALSGPLATPEKARTVANFPILQRWVGVQYHPETEIESHYGEMAIAKCYDLAARTDCVYVLVGVIYPVAYVSLPSSVPS